jgi:ligand-binding sensor domain-containing protein
MKLKYHTPNGLLYIALIVLSCLSGLRAQDETDRLDFIQFEWNNTVGTTRFNPVSYLQDSRGMMWMATSLGVVSFDGYNFNCTVRKNTA